MTTIQRSLKGRMDGAIKVAEMLIGEKIHIKRTPERVVELVVSDSEVWIRPVELEHGEAPTFFHCSLPKREKMTTEKIECPDCGAELTKKENQDHWCGPKLTEKFKALVTQQERVGNLRVQTHLEAMVTELTEQTSSIADVLTRHKGEIDTLKNKLSQVQSLMEQGKVMVPDVPNRVRRLERICIGNGDPDKAVSLPCLVGMAIDARDRLSELEKIVPFNQQIKSKQDTDIARLSERIEVLENLVEPKHCHSPEEICWSNCPAYDGPRKADEEDVLSCTKGLNKKATADLVAALRHITNMVDSGNHG